MKFGYQLGSGAVTQRDAFAASGKLDILRFPMVPDAAGTGFDQGQTLGSLQYCLQYKVQPHVTLFDAPRNYPTDKTAYVLLFLNTAYDMGVRVMSLEVGNEDDGSLIFPAYCSKYFICSEAVKQFKASRPYNRAKFMLGGTAATTGGWFTLAIMAWAKYHAHIFDFASWHHGTYCTNEELQAQIAAIKALRPEIPIWLTEVGDAVVNSTPEQVQDGMDWITGLFPPPNVDVFIWLTACPDIWLPDGTVTPMGQVLLNKL